MAEKAGLKIDDAANKKFLNFSEKRGKSSGKILEMHVERNMFEKFVVNQANRLVKLENPTRDDLMTIKEEDVFDR